MLLATMAGVVDDVRKTRNGHRCMAWKSPDRQIVCTVVPHSSAYQLVLTVGDRVVSMQAFQDWRRATDEAKRLRGVYLNP